MRRRLTTAPSARGRGLTLVLSLCLVAGVVDSSAAAEPTISGTVTFASTFNDTRPDGRWQKVESRATAVIFSAPAESSSPQSYRDATYSYREGTADCETQTRHTDGAKRGTFRLHVSRKADGGFSFGTSEAQPFTTTDVTYNCAGEQVSQTYGEGSPQLDFYLVQLPRPPADGRYQGSNTAADGTGGVTATWDLTVEAPGDPTCTGRYDDLKVLSGDLTRNILSGTDAAEQVLGLAGDDRLAGGGGGDCVRGGEHFDVAKGDDGDDDVDGGSGRDRVHGGAGVDVVNGGADEDAVIGGVGRDILLGGSESDVLIDGANQNTFDAGPGDDWVLSRQSIPERIDCGPGDDMVYADKRDTLKGCEHRMRKAPRVGLQTGPRSKPWGSGDFVGYEKKDMLAEVDSFAADVEENMRRCEVQNLLLANDIRQAAKSISVSGLKEMGVALGEYGKAMRIRGDAARRRAMQSATGRFVNARVLNVGAFRSLVAGLAIQQVFERVVLGNADKPCQIIDKASNAMSFLTSAYADPTVVFMRARVAFEPKSHGVRKDGCEVQRTFVAVRDGSRPPGGVRSHTYRVEFPGGCP